RTPFFRQRPGGTNVHALATPGAAVRRAPRLVEIGDDAGIDSPPHEVPGVSAFDFIADAHAAAAKDATVGIDHKTLVRGVDFRFRVAVGEVHVGDVEPLGQRL